MSARTLALRWATIATIFFASATARAQSAESPATLLDNGRAALRRGDNVQALALFQRAWDANHGALARALMGSAEVALGQWVEAEQYLHEAIASDDPWARANRARLTADLANVRSHLGSLLVEGGVAGAQVLLNGRAIATLPMDHPVRVLSQTATLEVRAEGYFTISRPVDVVSGERVTRERVDMVMRAQAENVASTRPEASPAPTVVASSPPPVAAPVSTAPRESAHADERPASESRPLAGPAAVAAVGVASFVVAGIFGAMRQGELGTLTTNCTTVDASGTRHCADTPTNRSALDGFRTDSIVADVGLGVGVAAIVVAAVWFVFGTHADRPARVTVHFDGRSAGLGAEF